MSSSYPGNVRIAKGATVELSGECQVAGNVVVEGILTHPSTADASDALIITVGGTLAVGGTGVVSATGKSAKKVNDLSYMSYGGTACGDDSCSSPYGDISNPMDLGSMSRGGSRGSLCGESAGGGGLIVITTNHLALNGTISARGQGCSSGGTVNIKITDSGDVTGDGLIDASVQRMDMKYAFEKAGGGRISLTGYGSASGEIISRANVAGLNKGVGTFSDTAGTFFYKSISDAPEYA
jgi:hypothetical protein